MEACLQVQVLSVYPSHLVRLLVSLTTPGTVLYSQEPLEEAVRCNYNPLLEGNKNICNHTLAIITS